MTCSHARLAERLGRCQVGVRHHPRVSRLDIFARKWLAPDLSEQLRTSRAVWYVILAVWAAGPLLAIHGLVDDLADLPWWGSWLLTVVAVAGAVGPLIALVRTTGSAPAETDTLLRPAAWLAVAISATVVIAAIIISARVIAELGDGQSLATAVRVGLTTPIEGVVVAVGSFLLLYLRLRNRRHDEDDVGTPAFRTELHRVLEAPDGMAPAMQHAVVDLLMKRASRHGDHRRLMVEITCQIIRTFPPVGTGQAPAISLPHLQARLFQHLRVTRSRFAMAHWCVRTARSGRRGSRGFWPESTVDLTGATLVHLDMVGCDLDAVHLDDANVRLAELNRSRYRSRASFSRAQFAGDADFTGARFNGGATFDGARFAGHADFTDTRFGGRTTFHGVEFAGPVRFSRSAIQVDLTGAYITGSSMAELPDRWTTEIDSESGRRLVIPRPRLAIRAAEVSHG